MDRIPFEEQYIINELTKLWQTNDESHDLVLYIRRFSGIGASIFRQVYEDLHSDKHSKYATFSPSEFKQFLETEYRQQVERQAQEEVERQARMKAEGEESKRRARAELEALRHVYINHCWLCQRSISSAIHARCPNCGWYICSCGACDCTRF